MGFYSFNNIHIRAFYFIHILYILIYIFKYNMYHNIEHMCYHLIKLNIKKEVLK